MDRLVEPHGLRSLLFVPASNPGRVAKALSSDADRVIIDLEDSVAVQQKELARETVSKLESKSRSRCFVRVNGIHTDWFADDVTTACLPGMTGLMVPKVESAADVHIASWAIRQASRRAGFDSESPTLLLLIETPAGVANLASICAAADRGSLIALGSGDLAAEAGWSVADDEFELAAVRSSMSIACANAGLQKPIDAVWSGVSNLDGLLRSAERAARMGFQGKLCIHPGQLPIVNRTFGVTEAQVAKARRVVEAFEAANRSGVASIQVDGALVDYVDYGAAQRLLAQLGAIKQSSETGNP